jgi:hypothetical protein
MAVVGARRLQRAAAAAVAVATVLVAASLPAAHALPSLIPTATASLSGEDVFDLTVLPSGRVVLGGSFTAMGTYPRANLAAVLPDGTADPDFAPTTNGPVRAVAASSDGSRVFIGGTFTEVNGVPRQNLAALDAVTGELIPGWQADTTGAKPTVQSLAVLGNQLFVGGRFSGIDGTAKAKFVKLDATNGDPLKWNTWVNGAVNEVRVAPNGDTVWIGGEFTKIRGLARPYFGGVRPATGIPTSFVGTSNGSRIITLAVSPNSRWLYVGNNSDRVVAYKVTQSAAPRWSRKADGNTQAMAVSSEYLYLGGHFASFIDTVTDRLFFAAVDRFTGALTSWDPLATGYHKGCWALAIAGDHLYAGGGFLRFNGVRQRLFARFDGTL